MRLLLVEDNPADAQLIAEMLRDPPGRALNASLTRVPRLADAVAELGREPFDVVLLDLSLPDSVGPSTVEGAVAAAGDVPVVVLTGTDDEALAMHALQLGAQDYLVKGLRLESATLTLAIRYAIERQRARRALREAETRYRLLWDASPLPKYVFDAETLRILEANEAALDQYGYAKEEFLGLRAADLRLPEEVPELLAQLARAGDSPTRFGPVRHRRRDGSVFDAEISASALPYRGRDARLVAVNDVTERRRAVERTEQLLAVTAALTDASTPDEVAERVATRVVEALGGSSASLASVLPGGSEARVLRSTCHGAGDGDRWSELPLAAPFPLAAVIRTGEPLWLGTPGDVASHVRGSAGVDLSAVRACAVLPLSSAERVIGAVAIGFACTRQFASEDREVLLAMARQCALALERAQLHEAAQRAMQAAQAASSAKSEYLAVTSHELRTPLNAIIGFVGLITDGIGGPVTELQQSYLGRVRRSAEHLLSLITELLTLSRLEANQDQVLGEPVLVASLVRETAELAEPSARAKGLTLTAELPDPALTVMTDVMKLRQILVNLIGNAIKFTDHGGVRINVRPSEGELAIEVSDTGIGIARENVERIFKPYWQVNPRAEGKAGGTGLGLSVSLRLARLLGGDLRVESVVGAGSTFTLVLPIAGTGNGRSLQSESGTGMPAHDVVARGTATVR